jgi:hypothetical protein
LIYTLVGRQKSPTANHNKQFVTNRRKKDEKQKQRQRSKDKKEKDREREREQERNYYSTL